MVESLQPVTAGALKALGDNLTPERVRELTGGIGGSVPGTMQGLLQDVVWGLVTNLLYDVLKELSKDTGFWEKLLE